MSEPSGSHPVTIANCSGFCRDRLPTALTNGRHLRGR
jgi:hypothetical protein